MGRRPNGRARRPAQSGGAGTKARIDLLTAGTFARVSEGSYLTSAPGDTTFMAWASVDARRAEDRGDGAGALLLLEGSNTNRARESEALATSPWSTLNSPTISPDAQAAPDGIADADTLAFGAGGSPGQVRQAIAQAEFTDNAPCVLSAYMRRGNASDQIALFLRAKDGATSSSATKTPASAWGREALVLTSLLTGASPILAALIESTDGADFDVWGAQFELRRAPSSYIRTTTAAATRAADSLVIAEADVPASLLTRRWRCPELSPVDGSADLVSGSIRWLFTVADDQQGIRIRHDGSDVLIEAVDGGAVVAESQALSYARHELLGAIEWDPAAGLVYVDGVAGPAGTPWDWAAGDLRIGGIVGGAGELYGRVGPTWREV